MNNQNCPDFTVSDFFKLTFGLIPVELDPTEFVTNELTDELFASLIEPSLRELNPTGIFRNLFPYLLDTISRTIPISKLINHIQEIINNENYESDDLYQILQHFEECTGRDFLIAFLDKVPKNSFSKILNTIVAANIPIPIYLSNDAHSQKGLKVLNGMRDIIAARNYHLFISINQTNTNLGTPFSKQLYKNYSINREDLPGICNPNSIDISFHAASENHSRPPLAISEVYYDELSSSALRETVKKLSRFAFYIVIHGSNDDFNGNELNDQFISTINDISIECYGGYKRKILVLFWGVKSQIFKIHKEKIEKLFTVKFANDEIWVDLVVNTGNKKNALFERIKKDSLHKLKDTEKLQLDWTNMNLSKVLGGNAEDYLSENEFALLIAELQQFNRRADIFYASYCENEIETLQDKTLLKTSEDSHNYQSLGEIYRSIQKFQDQQKNIGETEPISVLTYFANVIKMNDIKYMREFARQVDVYFKDYLISLTRKDDEIKNSSVESEQINIQRKEIKQKIEDLDITVHDFWREFVILSQIMRSDGSSVLKKLYDIDDKQLEKAYNVWIREGEAIQILEGVSLRTLNSDFLSSVLSKIMSNSKRQLIVISVIGLESSGKSTLLNYLFQCGFSTSAGRCTKGAYMSYRHTIYKEKELDVLIIDSEGMGSTAAKYISRRTDFDKKMTLLGFMCSQILIVNTKGLTRDISDILEVSSYHLDALSNRDSKPRISFVLRDMKDAKRAQHPAFLDIRDSLKRMFDEIPGCSYDMDNFMIVEEDDVHLLENAFACSFDNFYPQSMISDGEKFHYPAETFPLTISKLRKELLDSALIPSENHESQIFKNVHGFITHMQTVWKEIDARGNFLHFKNSKTIQQWSAMKKLVHSYNETTIKSYEENGLNLIKQYANREQWNENNDTDFETYLTDESERWCAETIADYKEKISNQYEPQIIEEGETHIKAAFAAKKRELKVIYAKMQRRSKESWLIKSAEKRIGDKVGEILKNHKNKTPEQYKRIFSKSKCDELFDDEWKKVEKDKENFMNTMAMKEKTLEQHVVNSFNHAVESGRAISNDDRDLKERLKFNRRFWNKITTPATLNTVSLDDKLFFDSIKISRANIFNPSNLATYIGIDDDKKKSFKGEVIDRIKTEIKGTCERICDDLLSRNALAIEFSQALEWLKSLCKNIFIIQSEINQLQSHFKVEIEDFSTMEQYLRLEVFVTLKNNTAKWKDSQLNNLENLRESLLKYFHEILNNSSYENISIHFLKCIDKSIKEQLVIQEQKISELLETHLKKNWKSEKKNPTRYAYEQSFGTYDVGKTRKYIDNPTSFMRELFENDIDTFKNIKVDEVLEDIEKTIYYALEKLGKNISILQQKLQINSSFTIEEIFQKIDAENNRINSQKISYKDLIEDAIRVLGKCTIDSPQDFCAILKEDHNKFLLDFKKLWRNDYTNRKQSMIYKVECSKQSYWNKVVGCRYRCPYCGSKCELEEHEIDTNHRASIHLMACFNGTNYYGSKEAFLIICNEPENFNIYYHQNNDSKDLLIWEENMKKNHPKWWTLLGRKQPDDDQIKQVRAMWVHLKTELCNKYNMVDKTPENWQRDYGHLAKNH